jgi:DDE family transposase
VRDSTTAQCVLFEGVFRKPGYARFDQAHANSDGGAIVLAAADRFHETRYAAGTWERERRVIIKAEVTGYPNREPRDNPRFVVTNLRLTPDKVYALYCQRGEIENRIKELHHGLAIDRTSCSRFLANQLRVLLTAAAFVLLQEVRRRAAGTRFHRTQVWTLREQLFKLGARVVTSARRVVLHLPASFPFVVPWRRVAIAFGARTG